MAYGNWADHRGTRARRRLMDRKKRIDDNGLEVLMLPQKTILREVEYMIGKIKSSSESGVFEINISKWNTFKCGSG